MRRVLILPLCAILLALGYIPSLSKTRFIPKTFGDWEVYEDLGHFDAPFPPAKGIPNAASTVALDGRRATLGITNCGRYTVSFRINTDSEFDGPKNPENEFKIIETRIVFHKVLPSDRNLWPMMLGRGDEEYFLGDADALARGAKLMICPTQDESPRCLNFSLRGITTVLKMICPRR